MVFVRDGACGHVVIKGSRGGFVFMREGVVMERDKVGISGKEVAVVAKWVNLYGNLGVEWRALVEKWGGGDWLLQKRVEQGLLC